MRFFSAYACLASLSLAFAQQPPDDPKFEVASIKPSDPNPQNTMFIGMSADGAMVNYANTPLARISHRRVWAMRWRTRLRVPRRHSWRRSGSDAVSPARRGVEKRLDTARVGAWSHVMRRAVRKGG